MQSSLTNEQIIQMRIQGKRESIDILADEVLRLRGYIESLETRVNPIYIQPPVIVNPIRPYNPWIWTTNNPTYTVSYNSITSTNLGDNKKPPTDPPDLMVV